MKMIYLSLTYVFYCVSRQAISRLPKAIDDTARFLYELNINYYTYIIRIVFSYCFYLTMPHLIEDHLFDYVLSYTKGTKAASAFSVTDYR